MKWLVDRWREKQRAIDVKVLWPICKLQANHDLNHARAAFGLHCHNDPAWYCLGPAEINRRIEELK